MWMPARSPPDIEAGTHVAAALATFLADELRLDVGQPDTIRPAVGIHLHPMRAFVIGAVDQDVTDTG